MPLPVYQLRRWLAVIAVLFIAVIAGMYLYARLRQHSVLLGFPGKISYDIKQTASGFQFSKSEAGRTLFTLRASEVKEFKLSGSAELHNVSIILYGRDASRFDQIYGDVFTYDRKTGDVTARGEVQIDLEANPTGVTGPDQATPEELKNPIHLNTRDLVFNQNSGDASTAARVDFRTPQAKGWAVGVQYSGKSKILTLASQIHVTLEGQDAASLFATHGRITHDPREIVLDHARLERESGTVQADEATFFLGPDNEVQRLLATGNVIAEATGQKPGRTKSQAAGLKQPDESGAKDDSSGQEPPQEQSSEMRARADEAELLLTGKQNLLRTATLTGNVHVERIGPQPMQGDAGRVILDFLGQNELQKVHASNGVRLTQHAASTDRLAADASEHASTPTSAPISTPQNFDLTAPIVDCFIAEGRRLDRAQTSGAAQITISPAQNANPASAQASAQRTVVTAGRFDAKFAVTPEGTSRLTSIHGAPDAKIVSLTPGLPDRVSTSQTLDAAFLPEGGIASIVEQGNVAYSDGLAPDKRTQAWADKALYTPADRILLLTGNPRIADGGMATTARTIRINRGSGDAFADGDVKSTYNELKEQPNGALLASASPIHVTAANMTAHNSTAVALYQGDARLWQDANIIEAPSIQFDRDRRSLLAQGTAAQPVSTVLVQSKPVQQKPVQALPAQALPAQPSKASDEKTRRAKAKSEENSGQSSPVAISSSRLTYADSDRQAHYEGGVVARGTGFTAASNRMDVYLLARSQTSSNQSLAGPGQLDRLVAQGSVLVQQPGRRAEGQTLVYTASDDKFVLTGGPPSIFDAERGRITGVSLTFFRRDDRVLVEGEASSPVVTQTRVAR